MTPWRKINEAWSTRWLYRRGCIPYLLENATWYLAPGTTGQMCLSQERKRSCTASTTAYSARSELQRWWLERSGAGVQIRINAERADRAVFYSAQFFTQL